MFATTADELLLNFREDVHDDVVYSAGDDSLCLWQDREIYRYMTVAVDRLARDTHGLVEVLTLPFVEGVPTVALPARVLEIRHVRSITHGWPMTPANTNSRGMGMTDDYGLRAFGSQSMFDSRGRPRTYVRDYQARALNLVPIPDTDGQIAISCVVTISDPMEAGTDLPFMEATDQLLVLEYMKHLAYRKQDAETEDLVRSDKALAYYKHEAPARKAEINDQRRTPGVVKMEW